MIYTVTFNPSLDYHVGIPSFTVGELHRTTHEYMLIGGKGINVSIVLKNLGVDSTMLGFTAGFTGAEIERRAKTYGVDTEFIHLDEGLTRINVKIETDEPKAESEINAQGPDIPREKLEELWAVLEGLGGGDTLILSGSIPNTLPSDVYEQILRRLSGRGIRFVVDATQKLLVNVLKYHPFLIKPNNHELGEIFQTTVETKDEVVFYGRKLQEMGAVNVLVSMAGAGAVLIASDGREYRSEAPHGKVVNSVGAGDSMVAGFIAGWEIYHGNAEKAFKMGLSAGSASAFAVNLATREQIMNIMNGLE